MMRVQAWKRDRWSVLSLVNSMCVVPSSVVPPKVEVEIGRPRTDPPTLIQDGSTLVYSEGTEHELLCSATGVPTPTVRGWKLKG